MWITYIPWLLSMFSTWSFYVDLDLKFLKSFFKFIFPITPTLYLQDSRNIIHWYHIHIFLEQSVCTHTTAMKRLRYRIAIHTTHTSISKSTLIPLLTHWARDRCIHQSHSYKKGKKRKKHNRKRYPFAIHVLCLKKKETQWKATATPPPGTA